ncbi:amidohydrolase family protein [Roseibium sp. CAU 1637]|uniref:Amidohydrolase family protein n=1 Tax=Roseibium limicola TaxID=2816037 RepID=A0A939EL57_9HYPH|nr:amidohydrolase family protein [Roseibium limicola]MBO0344145.1 amidohydrolase family protein [Roseibium limicola]
MTATSANDLRIDAHQHFWQVARGDYGWLTPALGHLYADYVPEDLAPMLKKHGITGTVLVQAAPTEAETTFMLSLADKLDFIKGVVGWTDLEAEDASARIARMARHPKLVGLRPMIQDIADDRWMLSPKLDPAFQAMIEHDLTFDALTLPRHLQHLLSVLRSHATLTTVIDHGSKPEIANGNFNGWAKDMKALAEETSAFCKLSGLVTEAARNWKRDDLTPYVDHLLACFGPSRLIWGSDWPVCTLAASYDQWIETTDWLLRDLSQADKDKILGANALRAYRLS